MSALLVLAMLALAAAAPAPAPGPGLPWLPRPVTKLQVLDKVNARPAILTLREGETGRYGSLTIRANQCAVRPSDQPADAVAHLVIVDSHEGAPGFSGWMFHSMPAASMLEHPIYDVRVLGCEE